MIVGILRHEAGISETTAFVKSLRAAIVNEFKHWTIRQETGFKCGTCGHHH